MTSYLDNAVENSISSMPLALQIKMALESLRFYEVCHSIWAKKQKYLRLDFTKIHRELNDSQLAFFLRANWNAFSAIIFHGNHFELDVNLLKSLSTDILKNVKSCTITSGKDETSIHTLKLLPKLVPNVKFLQLEFDLRISFVEEFEQLEELTVESSQSSELGLIFSKCKHLNKLEMCMPYGRSNITGISQCPRIKCLKINLLQALNACEEILTLSNLESLIVLMDDSDVTKSRRYIQNLVKCRGKDIEFWLIRGTFFNQINCLPFMILVNQCHGLKDLGFFECKFNHRGAIYQLPLNTQNLIFQSCPNLNNEYLLNFIKQNPQLKRLYLYSCPLLSEDVLKDILLFRRHEKCPRLEIYLSSCINFTNSYYQNWEFWISQKSVIKLIECKIPDSTHSFGLSYFVEVRFRPLKTSN